MGVVFPIPQGCLHLALYSNFTWAGGDTGFDSVFTSVPAVSAPDDNSSNAEVVLGGWGPHTG